MTTFHVESDERSRVQIRTKTSGMAAFYVMSVGPFRLWVDGVCVLAGPGGRSVDCCEIYFEPSDRVCLVRVEPAPS